MKLGTYAHISISVTRLRDALSFYESLGFKNLWGDSHPQPWTLMTDGRVNVHLYESMFPSPAIHYFSMNMDARIRELTREGLNLEQQKSRDGERTQHTFLDPNEMAIMLMHHDDAEMPRPKGESQSRLGDFGEISISTRHMQRSCDFWRKLGFTPVRESKTPYPWKTLSDGVLTIGIHQTGAFSAHALTFFSRDVVDRIAQLKSQGVSFSHEMKDQDGASSGAVLTSPDGQTFFLLRGDVD